MLSPHFIPASVIPEPVHHPLFAEHGISVWILRLDRIHPEVSGNKWLKLQGWLNTLESPCRGILTMGGPWSNHLHAAAAWCRLQQLPFTAVVRGHEGQQTQTLEDILQGGGRVVWAQRQAFANTLHWKQMAQQEGLLFVPMGGDGPAGMEGVKAYFDQYHTHPFDAIWCAAGTGTTLQGIMRSRLPAKSVFAFNPGIHDEQMELQVIQTARETGRNLQWVRLPGDHFGRSTSEQFNTMNAWFDNTGIPTDQVYTGKMIAAFLHYVRQENHLPRRILLVHTGGLQGNRSLMPGRLKFVG